MVTLEESRRLAFSKYLLTLANAQSKQPEPLASAALLGFHDAIEFFLQVASEKLNVGKPKIEFLEYWDLIAPKLAPNELPQREAEQTRERATALYDRLRSDNQSMQATRLVESIEDQAIKSAVKAQLALHKSGLKPKEIDLTSFLTNKQ
jgi:hypothetical protein